MDWLTPIDLYCERLGPEFWSEPVNACSNFSFLIAAWWGWSAAKTRGKLDSILVLLCVLAAGIGVGSFLFHTFATVWASFTDVIPIWSFVALYVVVAVIRLTGKSPWRVGGIAAGVMAVIVGIVWIMASGSATQIDASPDPLNGSGQYAPAVIALWVFAFICLKRDLAIRIWIVSAACVFSLALVARTVDLQWCAGLPHGTHFLWHLLNGLMVALLLQGLVRIEQPTTGPAV